MKGITPVVATILLLLITITIVGVTMVFFTRTVSTSTDSGSVQLNATTGQAAKMVRIDLAANTTVGSNVTIRNIGTQIIYTSELSVYVDNSIKTCLAWYAPSTGLPTTSLIPGSSASCSLSPANNCGGKVVKVASPAGQDQATCVF